MTHDELLNKLNFVWSVDEPQLNKAEQLRLSLRAVVELHKPVMAFTGGYDGLDNELWAEQCSDCSNNGFSQMYPCPTIQTIEKELS